MADQQRHQSTDPRLLGSHPATEGIESRQLQRQKFGGSANLYGHRPSTPPRASECTGGVAPGTLRARAGAGAPRHPSSLLVSAAAPRWRWRPTRQGQLAAPLARRCSRPVKGGRRSAGVRAGPERPSGHRGRSLSSCWPGRGRGPDPGNRWLRRGRQARGEQQQQQLGQKTPPNRPAAKPTKSTVRSRASAADIQNTRKGIAPRAEMVVHLSAAGSHACGSRRC